MKFIARLRKPDLLNELRALVLAGIALLLVFGVLEIIGVITGSGSAAVQTPSNPAGPDEFELNGQAMEHLWTEAAIIDPTPAQSAWYLATQLPSAIVLLTVLLMLLRMLNRARRVDPFTRATVRDLRWTAVVLLVGGTAASVVEMIATVGLSEGIKPDTITATWDLPVLWVFAGFVTLAVSEIVARGCAMREEFEGVV